MRKKNTTHIQTSQSRVAIMLHAFWVALLLLSTPPALADDIKTAYEYLQSGQFQKALPILHALAEKGDPVAQSNLGTMYIKGDGVPKDALVAAQWYEKAATSGLKHPVVAEAMFQLAALYRGHGNHPQDLSNSAYWTEQAANAGDLDAINNIGVLYYFGTGVEKNYAKAHQWFSQAAARDQPQAQFFIGELHRLGKGMQQDFAEAARWYERAARKAYPHALYRLGAMYISGTGVAADQPKGIRYLEQTAAQGHPEAKSLLGKVRQPSGIQIAGKSADPEYGYRWEKAIRTGSASGQRAYLERLRGPDGQVIQYKRTGACAAYKDDAQPFGQALIDCYTVSYDGQEKPVTLYLDLYRKEALFAPSGFNFVE